MASNFASPVSPIGLAGARPEERATFSWSDTYQRYSYFALVGLVALLVYSYWNMLALTAPFWDNAQYSHGYLVPFIALYVMWAMRPNPEAQEPPEGAQEATFLGLMPAFQFWTVTAGASLAALVAGYFLKIPLLQGVGLAAVCLSTMAYVLIGQPFQRVSAAERWIGLAMLLAAYGARLWASSIYMDPLDRYSFLLAMLGVFVMVGGWGLLKWAGPAVGFLFFMYPLPSAFEQSFLLYLQKLAAVASEVVLTILSQPVVRQGNKIIVDGIPLEVAEACSGLRMVTIFGGFAVAVALLIKRPWWDRVIILLSALPIALIVNITRIVATALLYRLFPEGETIHQLIHDYAGLAMMPIAMGLLYLELKILSSLTQEEGGIEHGHGGLAGQFGAPPVRGT
ncbi:exosortase/archaeosortase family protein [Botrimarina sp.]|uniref:exosortase/archaeosortase family protein n=1 Tax=Botrimarina sp. TaxID=2795802 RepID=UPI0032EAF1FD